MRRTYNGAPTLKRTESACLDLFSLIGSARRSPAGALQTFERAYAENPQLAIRIALWARDARGGAGERDTFRNILHWLQRKNPAATAALVASGVIPEIGRWDDLFGMRSEQVWPAVAQQVFAGLDKGDRLLAKWLPRSGPIAAAFCKALGASEAQWRKALASLSDTVEQRMCANQWASLEFSKVPSVAFSRYTKAFRRNSPARFEFFLEDVSKGTSTINAGVVFPHDVVKASFKDDAAATLQWASLPKLSLLGDVLPLCDVSGSMDRKVSGSTTAMDVCIPLGLLIAENLQGPFKDQVITFTETPEWHTVKGATLNERAQNLRGAKWGGSTNIQAAFDLILAAAKEAGEGFQMPKALLVFSDMEFDIADRSKTNHEVLERKFREAGFEVPKLVYWNLSGRAGNVPAGLTDKVALVSGYSAAIAEKILSGDLNSLSPYQVMLDVVGVPRYDVVGVTTSVPGAE